MRADVYLSANGHAASRSQAKSMIESGSVTVDGRLLQKASEEISEGDHAVEISHKLPYVGRGGLKLEGALDAFGLKVENLSALDVGASTGGFTDCLLSFACCNSCVN